MGRAKINGRHLGREARMVMHEDEHAILEAILRRMLGDDDCFAKVACGDGSDSGRAEDRLVLARFLERMTRQFALRTEARHWGTARDRAPLNGTP